jgi:hypothetical protein
MFCFIRVVSRLLKRNIKRLSDESLETESVDLDFIDNEDDFSFYQDHECLFSEDHSSQWDPAGKIRD